MPDFCDEPCDCCELNLTASGYICWAGEAHRRAFKQSKLVGIPPGVRQIFAAPQPISAGSLFFSNQQPPPFGAQRGYLNTITPSSYLTAST